MVTQNVSNLNETLNGIFNTLWKSGLLNSNVLCQDEHGIWSLYIFMPYQNDCSTLSYLKLASFTMQNFTKNMSLTIEELFPSKLNNFQNCTLLVAPSMVDPFVVQRIALDVRHQYRGIDIKIIKQISKALNFVIEFVQSQDRSGHGVIHRNGTVTGNLGLVLQAMLHLCLECCLILFLKLKVLAGGANVTIGGYILSDERYSLFTPSNPYIQASMAFCYTEDLTYLSFTGLTAPFTKGLWIVISVLLLAASVVILLTKKLNWKLRHFFIGGRRNRTPILNVWTSLLGNCIGNPRITYGYNYGTFARTLIILWIFLWFVIRSCYQGAFYTNLQTQQSTSPYDTIAKIRDSNCKIISSPSGYHIIQRHFKCDR